MSSDSLFPADESPHSHHLALIRHARRLETSLQVDITRERRLSELETRVCENEDLMREQIDKLTNTLNALQIDIAKSAATTKLVVVLCTGVLGPILVLVAQKALGLH